jgi:hypothetical protein
MTVVTSIPTMLIRRQVNMRLLLLIPALVQMVIMCMRMSSTMPMHAVLPGMQRQSEESVWLLVKGMGVQAQKCLKMLHARQPPPRPPLARLDIGPLCMFLMCYRHGGDRRVDGSKHHLDAAADESAGDKVHVG